MGEVTIIETEYWERDGVVLIDEARARREFGNDEEVSSGFGYFCICADGDVRGPFLTEDEAFSAADADR